MRRQSLEILHDGFPGLEDQTGHTPWGLDSSSEIWYDPFFGDREASRSKQMPKVFTPEVECVHPEAKGLTQDQLRAFVVVTDRLAAGERVTKLTGGAGTGKSFMLPPLIDWARRHGFEVTVTAPTHKAVGVLVEKLQAHERRTGASLDVECQTIHSLLGLLLVPDMENDTGERILTAPPKQAVEQLANQLVICDESSMLGSVLKSHIAACDPRVSWLFVGDLAQLPPVGEGISHMLSNPHATLTRVKRQAKGSEIINLATRIRRGDMSMVFLSGSDVRRVADADELFREAHKRFREDEARHDPSHARILTFRNSVRIRCNEEMRKLLIHSEAPYVEGEWLTMYSQFYSERSRLDQLAEEARRWQKGDQEHGRAWRRFFEAKEAMEDAGGVSTLHVSQEVLVIHVAEDKLRVGDDRYEVWTLTVKTRDDQVEQLPVLKAESSALHGRRMREAQEKALSIRREMNAALEEAADESAQDEIMRSWQWQELNRERKKWWCRWFCLEETFAWVDYPYALTTHKSQGSTFTHAFVDVPDLMHSGGMQKQLLYTACTRASDTLTFCK